jgi:hypothetical protein
MQTFDGADDYVYEGVIDTGWYPWKTTPWLPGGGYYCCGGGFEKFMMYQGMIVAGQTYRVEAYGTAYITYGGNDYHHGDTFVGGGATTWIMVNPSGNPDYYAQVYLSGGAGDLTGTYAHASGIEMILWSVLGNAIVWFWSASGGGSPLPAGAPQAFDASTPFDMMTMKKWVQLKYTADHPAMNAISGDLRELIQWGGHLSVQVNDRESWYSNDGNPAGSGDNTLWCGAPDIPQRPWDYVQLPYAPNYREVNTVRCIGVPVGEGFFDGEPFEVKPRPLQPSELAAWTGDSGGSRDAGCQHGPTSSYEMNYVSSLYIRVPLVFPDGTT